mmetsp:Transcript_98536/g.284317  ORF Transcript_98536/g.284317 Transcript_98536/m.284317 type:complete len:203 (-) Transcript_98536:1852-2460(-)
MNPHVTPSTTKPIGFNKYVLTKSFNPVEMPEPVSPTTVSNRVIVLLMRVSNSLMYCTNSCKLHDFCLRFHLPSDPMHELVYVVFPVVGSFEATMSSGSQSLMPSVGLTKTSHLKFVRSRICCFNLTNLFPASQACTSAGPFVRSHTTGFAQSARTLVAVPYAPNAVTKLCTPPIVWPPTVGTSALTTPSGQRTDEGKAVANG